MMAGKATKTEHSGAKNSSASGGYWGYRSDAKKDSRSCAVATARLQSLKPCEVGDGQNSLDMERGIEGGSLL